MEYKNILNFISAAIGTTLTYLLGGWDNGIRILALFITIDYITGFMKSIYIGNLSSEIGWRGLIKKAGIFIVIILAHQLDTITMANNPIFRTMASYFYIANEGISITENIVELGLPIPSGIKKALKKLKENNEECNYSKE